MLADGSLVSNGNFHGAPVGYVLDFLAIARRRRRLDERAAHRPDARRQPQLRPARRSSPHQPGVDSGLMIAQYAQAALVAEMKRLATPASVDSIPSSAMQEDHVSMGWHAARKLRRSLDGFRDVVAIELLAARARPRAARATRGLRRRRRRSPRRVNAVGSGPVHDRWLVARDRRGRRAALRRRELLDIASRHRRARRLRRSDSWKAPDPCARRGARR